MSCCCAMTWFRRTAKSLIFSLQSRDFPPLPPFGAAEAFPPAAGGPKGSVSSHIVVLRWPRVYTMYQRLGSPWIPAYWLSSGSNYRRCWMAWTHVTDKPRTAWWRYTLTSPPKRCSHNTAIGTATRPILIIHQLPPHTKQPSEIPTKHRE